MNYIRLNWLGCRRAWCGHQATFIKCQTPSERRTDGRTIWYNNTNADFMLSDGDICHTYFRTVHWRAITLLSSAQSSSRSIMSNMTKNCHDVRLLKFAKQLVIKVQFLYQSRHTVGRRAVFLHNRRVNITHLDVHDANYVFLPVFGDACKPAGCQLHRCRVYRVLMAAWSLKHGTYLSMQLSLDSMLCLR